MPQNSSPPAKRDTFTLITCKRYMKSQIIVRVSRWSDRHFRVKLEIGYDQDTKAVKTRELNKRLPRRRITQKTLALHASTAEARTKLKVGCKVCSDGNAWRCSLGFSAKDFTTDGTYVTDKMEIYFPVRRPMFAVTYVW